MELFTRRVTRDPTLAKKRRLLLVHGILLVPDGSAEAGTPFAHAWVWQAGQCWFTGLLDGVRISYSIPRDLYYATMRLQEFTAYTPRQAYVENHRSGHYGPWRDAYQRLCNDGGPRTLYPSPIRIATVHLEA
jgi:hypothetical protein